MLKRLLKFMIISLVLANLGIPNVSAAETFPVDQFPIKDLEIQLMPELDYPEGWPNDQPSLLTAFFGTLENNTGADYNGEIEFPVPVNDENFEVYLVADLPTGESEVQRPFEIDKEKNVLKWTPNEPIKKGETYNFVIEYYTNPFKTDAKEFTFEYINQVNVENLLLILIAPLNADNIVVEPKAHETDESMYGEELHFFDYKKLEKGTSTKVSVSYEKDGNEPTISMRKPPNDENHSGTDGTENAPGSDRPIIGIGGAIVIGVSIIIAGVFVFLGLRSNAGSTKSSKAKPVRQGNKKQHGNKPATQKPSRNDSSDKKKKLRSLLVNGKIDQETYEQELKKLG